MGILSKILGRRRSLDDEKSGTNDVEPTNPSVVPLPAEPYVFECRVCGKVFEARRRRPLCPECDSEDVALMSG